MDGLTPTGWNHTEITPIREKVFEYLKNAILKGEIKAGERIVERELSEKLNISRTPIREALFRLESLGFVKTLPRKGVVVSRMTKEDIIEIFTILSTLECLGARLAAERLTLENESHLDGLIKKIDDFLQGHGEEKDNSLFHVQIIDTIYQMAKSPRLYEILNSLVEYIRAFAFVSQDSPERTRKAFEEHREIARAIRNRDAELAESLIKSHIENSKQSFLETQRP